MLSDAFRGDDARLVESIEALLQLDAKGALVPHGLGGRGSHASQLLSAAAVRLAAATDRIATLKVHLWCEEMSARMAWARHRQLRALAQAVTDDASPNSDGALASGDAVVQGALILALRQALDHPESRPSPDAPSAPAPKP